MKMGNEVFPVEFQWAFSLLIINAEQKRTWLVKAKIKLSICLIKHYVIKASGNWKHISTHS
jgi:hypothetical protein